MLAILAAGTSRRFGDQDKLTSLLGRKMLGLHAAESLATFDCEHRIITAPGGHECVSDWKRMGYEIIPNNDGSRGQAVSVKIAAGAAKKVEADALIICLADMPFVTTALLEDLVASFHKYECSQVIASTNGKTPMPPAIFPASAFDQLAALEGDKGARSLLQTAELIHVNEHVLMDIDTAEDLAQANRSLP